MNAQDLKNSILQLAIQGKLVGQRKEEGTAKELLEQIKAEKEQLIKEKKIKKEIPLPEITENEMPFDIPESWEWVQLGEVCTIVTGRLDANAQNPKGEYAFFTCGIEVFKTFEYAFDCDAILLGGNNASGDYKMHRYSGKFNAYQRVYVISGAEKEVLDYIFYVIKYWLPHLKRNSQGTTTRFIKIGQVSSMKIPLPPLEEQKRLVSKIEELMPYIEKYGEAHSKLEEFNKKFPEDMQKSILQYAIQGKLVEQREEEGTAAELYHQIQEEKARLIKEGKIKKEKPLAEITEEEIPFEIPESWKWVRLGDIVSILGDGIHGTPNYNDSGEFYFINGNNLSNGKIEIKENTKRVDFNEFINYRKELNANTVLVSINGTIGNVAFFNNEKIILGKSACYFNLLLEELKFYAFWIIKTKYFLDYAVKNATGSTIKNISLATMKDLLVPLPPQKEQKRIVARIEEMIPFCQQLVK